MKVPHPHYRNCGEIADFAEIECIRRNGGTISVVDISRAISRSESSHDDEVRHVVYEAFNDLVKRSEDCGLLGRYPFELDSNGTVVQLPPHRGRRARYAALYQYLLLVTRLNMKSEKTQENEDGTQLFELLCSEVAQSFFSTFERSSQAFVFGTGKYSKVLKDGTKINRRGFEKSVNELCLRVGEGDKFVNRNNNSYLRANDGRLDVIA